MRAVFGARVRVLVILACLGIGTAIAAQPNDAGSGTDAGDTRDNALLLASFGSYGGNAQNHDVDWFRVNHASSEPQCVRAEAGGAEVFSTAVSAKWGDEARTVGTLSPANGKSKAGLTVPALGSAYLSVKPSQAASSKGGAYDFSLATTSVPSPSSGDALTGTDAGSTVSGAIQVPGSCFGGWLSFLSLSDAKDVYAISARAGEVITLSFATASDAGLAKLSLVDSLGSSLADPIPSGGVLAFSVPADGTYYAVTAFTTSSRADVGYLIGVIVGPPDDPGPGCRPYC